MSLEFTRDGTRFLVACTVCGSVQQTSPEDECVACVTRKVVDGYADIVVSLSRSVRMLTETVERLVNP